MVYNLYTLPFLFLPIYKTMLRGPKRFLRVEE